MQGKVDICGVNTSRLTVLSQAETDMLLRRVKEGDEAARQKLIEGNLRLVLAVIQRFDKRGEFIAQAFNGLPQDGVIGPGSGRHAEALLMAKYGDLLKTIVISRIGHGGEWRPIEPCHNCRKMADKLGVKLITIDQCKGEPDD